MPGAIARSPRTHVQVRTDRHAAAHLDLDLAGERGTAAGGGTGRAAPYSLYGSARRRAPVFVSARCCAGHALTLTHDTKEKPVTLGTILLIVLVLMLIGAIPTWSHSRSWGYGPSGGLGLVLVVVVALLLMGRL
jgi:hypothetical protein